MVAEQKYQLNRSLLIKLFITFGVPLVICLLPVNEIFTHEMKLAIVFTVWMLIWSAFDLSNLAIPALIYPALLMIFQVVPAASAFAVYLGTTMYGALGCLLLANVLNNCGLLKRVAYWIAKTCGGSFNKTVYAIFFATFAVSICTFASGSVVCAALCFGMCKALDLMKTKEGSMIMMAGMLGASTVRMFLYYPVTMGPLISSAQTVDPNFTLNFMQLLRYNWPILLYCLLFIFLMQFFGKTKQSAINGSKAYFAAEYAKLGKLTRREKVGTVGVIAILLWILTNPLHGLDCMYAFIFIPPLLCMPGIDVGTEQDIKEVPIGTFLFFGSCMTIGIVCGAVGITALIASSTAPLLSGLGNTQTLIGVLGFGVVANLAMTPVAMLAGFTGMLYQIALNIGMDPLAVIFTFNYATDMVFLPYEYLTFLVFFAFG